MSADQSAQNTHGDPANVPALPARDGPSGSITPDSPTPGPRTQVDVFATNNPRKRVNESPANPKTGAPSKRTARPQVLIPLNHHGASSQNPFSALQENDEPLTGQNEQGSPALVPGPSPTNTTRGSPTPEALASPNAMELDQRAGGVQGQVADAPGTMQQPADAAPPADTLHAPANVPPQAQPPLNNAPPPYVAPQVNPALLPFQEPGGMGLVAPPMGGFPSVQGFNTDDLFSNIEETNRAEWKNFEATQAYVVALLVPGNTPGVIATLNCEMLTAVLRQLFPNNADIVCVTPDYKYQGGRICPLFAHGFQRPEARTLLERGLWTSPDFTFFTFPVSDFASPFIVTLQGFLVNGTETEREDRVAEIVRGTLRGSQLFRSHIRRYRDALQHNLTDEQAVQTTLDSVDVAALEVTLPGGENMLRLYNVYIRPPSMVPRSHNAFVQVVANTTFKNVRYGTAKAYKSGWGSCSLCHAKDHPRGLCFFANIDGLNLTPTQQGPATRGGRGGGRGNGRGRGRGRGRGTFT